MTEASILVSKRVLICEDEGIMLMQLQKALTRAGLVIAGTVSSGEEAVEVAVREKPDIILMDVKMNGMDGLEATRRIMEQHKTCIVMVTANADKEHMELAKANGAVGFVPKPVDSAALLPLLENALHMFYHCEP